MNLFQTKEWEEFKLQTGYSSSERLDGVLFLSKKLFGSKTFLYSPLVDKEIFDKYILNSENMVKSQNMAMKNGAIFWRLELLEELSDLNLNTKKWLEKSGFIKSFEEMQPEHTILLELTKSEDEILLQMKPKGRYNIRVSQKHNVVVKEDKSIDNFYSFYELMAKRQGITYRGREYFQKLFDILGKSGYCNVLTAYYDNKPVASGIFSFLKPRAIYLFGGSGEESRNVMAPYALQWEAIKRAKKAGCYEYDFFGVAPENMPNHKWGGVTRFKEQFGGRRIQILGSYDLVFKPIEYKLFKLAEKIRR